MARIDNYEQRFGGIGRLYGADALARLRQAHICVIGIGGVGSWAVEALARSCVGKITMIDMDDICVTNINRQIHALTGNIGQLKTEVMQQRVKLINPECDVQIIDDFISGENLAKYIHPDYDYVIDAIEDPLLAKVRSVLRKDFHFTQNPKRKFAVDSVFSTQPIIFPQVGDNCTTSATMNCANGFGAATMITATFGFFAVSRVLEKLLPK